MVVKMALAEAAVKKVGVGDRRGIVIATPPPEHDALAMDRARELHPPREGGARRRDPSALTRITGT